jgi:hypothetical protein
MGCRISQFLCPIAGAGDDLAAPVKDNGTDGDLFAHGGCPGFFEGQGHEG